MDMPVMHPLTFVVATNNRKVLEHNLLQSCCLHGAHPHQILIQEGFKSASMAYNDAIERSSNDLIIFVHQDIIFPETWLSDLERALNHLDRDDPEWGVIGSYGATLHDNGRGYIYSTGLGVMGKPFEHPARVQTLDE